MVTRRPVTRTATFGDVLDGRDDEPERSSNLPAVVGPVQQRLALPRPAGDVARLAMALKLAHVAAHGLPALDLPGILLGEAVPHAWLQGRELEIPALRVGHQKVAKRLHARDGLEFFRIDEVGVERDRIGVGKQLYETAVALDQIVRQHGDT